jgi:cell division protein FtsL
VAYVLVSQQIQFYKGNKTFRQNQEKISQRENENNKLAKEKEKYKSDGNIEKLAREKLGYVKPGEKVYIDKEQ